MWTEVCRVIVMQPKPTDGCRLVDIKEGSRQGQLLGTGRDQSSLHIASSNMSRCTPAQDMIQQAHEMVTSQDERSRTYREGESLIAASRAADRFKRTRSNKWLMIRRVCSATPSGTVPPAC